MRAIQESVLTLFVADGTLEFLLDIFHCSINLQQKKTLLRFREKESSCANLHCKKTCIGVLIFLYEIKPTSFGRIYNQDVPLFLFAVSAAAEKTFEDKIVIA